ncbi:unnamed protein product [Rhizophagus irregularis]|nr:unnamed protein product [Rhizophagus irregularis]
MASSSNTDTDKSIQWIENGIKNRYLIYYERSEFQNQEFISEGALYVLYKTNWESFNTVVALKSFKGTCMKEIVNEIQLLYEIHLHANIIKFVGITKRKICYRIPDNEYNNGSDYSLILEYADGELQNRKREGPVPRMANKYVDIYTGCLQSNPNDRPNIREVLSDLKSLEILPMEMDENSFNLDNYEVLIDRMYEKFLQEGGINKDNFNLLINQYITSNNNNENEILKYLSDNIDKQKNIILLGEFFRQGIGTEKDEIKAFELYKAAAENGNINS